MSLTSGVIGPGRLDLGQWIVVPFGTVTMAFGGITTWTFSLHTAVLLVTLVCVGARMQWRVVWFVEINYRPFCNCRIYGRLAFASSVRQLRKAFPVTTCSRHFFPYWNGFSAGVSRQMIITWKIQGDRSSSVQLILDFSFEFIPMQTGISASRTTLLLCTNGPVITLYMLKFDFFPFGIAKNVVNINFSISVLKVFE